MASYLIIGGVAGGMSAAARLRRLDETAEIIVLERGEHISYANCGLPYYIGDTITDRSKLLVQTPESFKLRFNVDVRVFHEAISVDPVRKVVRVRDLLSGRDYDAPYDKLLLSPGGSPVKPKIPGADHQAIHTLWTIPDTDRIRTLIDQGKVRTALIVGAGFIGLEMAENLVARGLTVTVVEAARQAMNVIDFEMAALVHRELRNKGVELLLEDGVAAFEKDGETGVTARLTSGRKIAADLVLLSIGVAPNTRFLAGSGIDLGPRGHIVVDASLRTSVEFVYAAGDAIEVVNPLSGKKTALPLAGPANKQGRIAADNMHGLSPRTYDGTMGTAIAKIFDLDVGITGATEKFCVSENIRHESVIIHPNDHAGYYPGATMLSLKLLFSPTDRRVLGVQAVGYGGVDKRIDVIATAIMGKMTVDDLCEIEHAYAPPYSSAKDPINMAGFAAQNILDGLVKSVTWDSLPAVGTVLDVRTPEEFGAGTIPGALNIPVDSLRKRLGELPRDKPLMVFCRVGLRGYIAARILAGNGFTHCMNLSGGYETWRVATHQHDPKVGSPTVTARLLAGAVTRKDTLTMVEINACGLQCPGPIIRLKEEMDLLTTGQSLRISASDPGFQSDAQAWARSTGNSVRDIRTEKGIVTAILEKGGVTVSQAPTTGNDKTIVVFSGDLDKVIAAFIIANGALAMGRKVTLFFTFWGLNALRKPEKMTGMGKNLVEAAFGMMMPRGSEKLALSNMSMGGIGGKLIRGIMKNKNVPALEELMTMAMKSGAHLVACQMSMELMGIRREELIEGIEIGGVAAYLEASEQADNNLFI
jgi:NADPH-dependent 2,4-dienoyl-CoA reductase/sulfur reductase-like enzyme/peroxiredoxin family protein/rhodanese-related sulfurtransferase/TusA-related sulfurtransferase